MVAKKIVVGLSTAVIVSAITLIAMLNNNIEQKEEQLNNTQNAVSKKIVTTPSTNNTKKSYDMYSSSIYDLPLSAIYDISQMPKSLKESVDNVLEEAQGFYLLKYDKNEQRVFIILQNSITESKTFPRHNLEFLELYINADDGKILKNLYSPAYTGKRDEVFLATFEVLKDETWVFDKNIEPQRPLKHVIYDSKGKTKFTEIWNYDDNKEIKYQLKNSSKNILSMLKEYSQNETGLRKEHLFYDSEGNLMLSLAINYEGANITRVIFYDKHNASDSMSIISYYENGLKIKEEIYNSDYKLIKTFEAEYLDGERNKIRFLNHADDIVTEISK